MLILCGYPVTVLETSFPSAIGMVTYKGSKELGAFDMDSVLGADFPEDELDLL